MQLDKELKKHIDNHDVEAVRNLVSNSKAEDFSISIHTCLNFRDPWFPLKGYADICEICCSSGIFDLNVIENKKTPLTALAMQCHNSTEEYSKLFDSFLKNGADPNVLDGYGWSSLAYVINKLNVSPKIVESLIDAQANINLIVSSKDFIGIKKRSILGMAYYNSPHFFSKLKKQGATMTEEEILELKERNLPLEPESN